MSIVKRIIQIVESEKPETRFSQKTHILSGKIGYWRKNKDAKPQFDVITAILEAYPEINVEWFILGKGLMYSKITYNDENYFTTIKEPGTTYKKENLKCVLTGADCSFREMDGLRQEVEKLRKENEKLKKGR